MEKTTYLSPDLIKAVADKFSLEIVFILELPSAGVKELAGLEQCINLLHLTLSHNKISRIRGLEQCTQLVHLDLSYNQIGRIEGLAQCLALEKLELQGNRINSMNSVDELMPLQSLRSLYLREFDFSGANPICNEPGYRGTLFSALPQLRALDGHRKNLPVLMHDDYSQYEVDTSGMDVAVDKTSWVKGCSVPDAGNSFEDRELNSLIKECRGLLDKGTRIIASINS